ncbi:zinc finger protein 423-like [Culex pipiens pallens]|uniref:zinc finger protein 423-like n=1 Tax=Culex pipiens pallens TaxID=42434 RepID=UPI0019538A87|nr:zinc finger protein 423-like [Culex pipiens pallens]
MESDELIIEHKPLIIEPDDLPPPEQILPESASPEWFEILVPDDDEDDEEQPTTYIEDHLEPDAPAKPISLVARFDLDDPECTTLTVAELPPSKRTPPASTSLTDFVHKCHYCVSRFMAMNKQFRGHVARHARIECGAGGGTCEQRFHLESEHSWHRHYVHGQEIDWEAEELGMLHICKCCHLRFADEDDILMHLNDCHRGYIEAEFPERVEALDVLVARKRTEENRSKASSKLFCKNCSLLFIGTSYIEAHLRLHKEKRIVEPPQQLRDYRCIKCFEEFFSRGKLIDHLNEHAAKNPSSTVCCFCTKMFRTRDTLDIHIRLSHAVPNRIRCGFCEATLKRAEHYWSHCRAEHGAVKGFGCGKCDQVFRSALECQEHDEQWHAPVGKVERKRKVLEKQQQRSRDKRVGVVGTLGENGKNRAIYIE